MELIAPTQCNTITKYPVYWSYPLPLYINDHRVVVLEPTKQGLTKLETILGRELPIRYVLLLSLNLPYAVVCHSAKTIITNESVYKLPELYTACLLTHEIGHTKSIDIKNRKLIRRIYRQTKKYITKTLDEIDGINKSDITHTIDMTLRDIVADLYATTIFGFKMYIEFLNTMLSMYRSDPDTQSILPIRINMLKHLSLIKQLGIYFH